MRLMLFGTWLGVAASALAQPMGEAAAAPGAAASWKLVLHGGAKGQLAEDPAGTWKVTIESTDTNKIWSVQLVSPNYALEAGKKYLLRFSVHAAEPRSLGVSVGQAHAPWANLGLYRAVQVAAEGKEFTFDFTPNRAEPLARVHFDLGGSQVGVQIANVSLAAEDGSPAAPSAATTLTATPGPTAPAPTPMPDSPAPATPAPATETPAPTTPEPATPEPTTPAPATPAPEAPATPAPETAAPAATATPEAAGAAPVQPPTWVLRSANEEASGELVVNPQHAGEMRVQISKAGSGKDWHLQLRRTGIAVKKEAKYLLRFRARAEAARKLTISMVQDHEPWTNVGLYRVIDLTTEWQPQELEFPATLDDDKAVIQFSLGASAVPVELADVELRTGDTLLVGPESTAAPSPPEPTPPTAPSPAAATSEPMTPPTPSPAATASGPAAAKKKPKLPELPPDAWRVSSQGGAAVEMKQDNLAFLITQTKPGTGQAWEVQLKRGALALEAGKIYRVRFRARAEAARKAFVSISQNHEPWQNLGLYRELALTPEGQTFQFEFEANANEPNARIHFDLGTSTEAVEIADIEPLTPVP